VGLSALFMPKRLTFSGISAQQPGHPGRRTWGGRSHPGPPSGGASSPASSTCQTTHPAGRIQRTATPPSGSLPEANRSSITAPSCGPRLKQLGARLTGLICSLPGSWKEPSHSPVPRRRNPDLLLSIILRMYPDRHTTRVEGSSHLSHYKLILISSN